jgi:hypothetical protein
VADGLKEVSGGRIKTGVYHADCAAAEKVQENIPGDDLDLTPSAYTGAITQELEERFDQSRLCHNRYASNYYCL